MRKICRKSAISNTRKTSEKKGTDQPVSAFVNTNEIGLEFKDKYYWNIACGEDKSAGWLLPEMKDIGFSSKKSEISWQNVAIFEDGTTADIAAHSKGFKVVGPNGDTMMAKQGNYISKATVSFPGTEKTFHINFGSVNSSSDMGALTPDISVSDNCIEAEITYDFNLNKVSIAETKFGESLEDLKIESFTAVPSVCLAGEDVMLKLQLNDSAEAQVVCKRGNNENVTVTLIKDSESSYHIPMKDLKAGVYTFTVSLSRGETKLSDIASINVKVLSSGPSEQQNLTVNAYEDINWDTIGRYKANFHTHTSQSFDTQFTTTQVVDKYKNADYDILALTDHDASTYPWSMFSLYNTMAQDRNPEEMGILAIPGIELSKDRRNNWSESTGGEFNHHNDFFTGRKGQEFMSLRESYAYTQAIGGMQIINHPGQYWNLSTEYKAGEKNSPEWHAENFRLFNSLIGLEVYNQGNRRPNDRILWDRILSINMPDCPVWGYSCDDTHTAEQYFRNYQYMLMPDLTVDALKEAMKAGATVFSYEYKGSGKALAPHINSITVDEEANTITIDSDDADTIEWISSTHRTGTSASTTVSSVIGLGKTFDFSDFKGSYVRARLINKYGETATQPFGFTEAIGNGDTNGINSDKVVESKLTVFVDNITENVKLLCSSPMKRISLVNTAGMVVRFVSCNDDVSADVSTVGLPAGVYVAVVATADSAYTAKFILN